MTLFRITVVFYAKGYNFIILYCRTRQYNGIDVPIRKLRFENKLQSCWVRDGE